MSEVQLGSQPCFHFGDKLLLAISDKYMKLINGKPLEFSGKINEKNQLVLSAQLTTKGDKTNHSTSEEANTSD